MTKLNKFMQEIGETLNIAFLYHAAFLKNDLLQNLFCNMIRPGKFSQ